MTGATGAPAGAWRRYAAWSLDFALVGGTATALSWPWLVDGWHLATAAWQRLSDLLARALADGLLGGATPDALAQGLLANPRIEAAASDLQHAITQLLLAWLLCYGVLAAAYHVGFERSRWRGSPGKHALDLVVVDARSGTTAATWRLLLRHFAGGLSWLTLNLGHLLAALPPRRQALHDLLSGTRVLSTANAALPWWARAWLLLQLASGLVLVAWCLQRYSAALLSSLL